MSNKINNRINFSLNILPIILWLLPLLALNIGFRTLSRIDQYWEQINSKENIRQELERLNTEGQFSWMLAQSAGKLKSIIKSNITAIGDGKLFTVNLKSKVNKALPTTLPEYDLLVFKTDATGLNTKLLFSNKRKVQHKYVKCKIFEYLVNIAQEKNISSKAKDSYNKKLTRIMGDRTKGKILAGSQKGKTTYIVYNNFPHWFTWDCFTTANKKTYGFFLFSKIGKSDNQVAQHIAINNLKKRHPSWESAYIHILDDGNKDALSEKLSKSTLFKNWKNKSIQDFNVKEVDKPNNIENNFEHWIKNGEPQNIKLGNYLFSTYLGKQSVYLSVIGIPQKLNTNFPLWIWLINLIVISLTIMTLIRGLLQKKWLNIKLKSRFFLTYTLAATLPISLLLIGSNAYISQFKLSSQNKLKTKLKVTLNQFDSEKLQFMDQYKSTFSNLCEDKKLIDLLRHGITNPKNKIDISNRINTYFQKRGLPIFGFALIDPAGNRIRGFGKHKEEDVKPSLEATGYPLLMCLRNFMKKTYSEKLPDDKTPAFEKVSAQTYKAFTNLEFAEELERRRGFAISRTIGAATTSHLHEFISIDNKVKYVFTLAWRDSELDKRTVKTTIDTFGLNSPEINLLAYKKTQQGLIPIIKPTRHMSKLFLEEALKAATTSSIRCNLVNKMTDKYSIVAMIPLKYTDTIIVGGTSLIKLNNEIARKKDLLILILITSVLIIISLGFLTASMIIEPISAIKYALDRVTSGDLELNIESQRQDDIGTLTAEFSSMLNGLKERKQLATLVSEQALEALSSDDQEAELLAGKSFKGVALVSDIRNFTGICEQFHPNDVTELLNKHFEVMTVVISKYGGKIYKFIGDAVEAVFQDDAEMTSSHQALAASLEILERISEINNNRKQKGLFEYKIGIGLAYGNMVSGAIGSKETRLDYTIIGEPLKQATHLESLSKQNLDFPIVVDSNLKNIFEDNNISLTSPFVSLASDDITGFTSSSENNLKELCKNVRIKKDEQHKLSDTEQHITVREFGNSKTPVVAFIIGTIILLGLIFIINAGFNSIVNDKFEQFKSNTIEQNTQLKAQLKSDDSLLLAFELKMKDIIEKITSKINFSKDADEFTKLKKLSKSEFSKLEKNNVASISYAVINFTKYNSYPNKYKEIAKHCLSSGLEANEIDTIQNICAWAFTNSINISPKYQRNKAYKLFGLSIRLEETLLEMLGLASKMSFKGKKSYVFLQFITKFDPNFTNTAFSNNNTRICKITPKNYRIIGILFAAIPLDSIQEPESFLTNYFASDNIELSINSDKKSWKTTNFSSFSQAAKKSTESIFTSKPNYIVTKDAKFNIGSHERQLTIIKKIPFNSRKDRILITLFSIITLIIIIIYWSKTFTNSTLLKRTLSLKLLLTSIMPAIIPLASLVIVANFFILEQQNTKLYQAKVDLLDFLDRMERRCFFVEPVTWHLCNKIVKSKQMKEIMHDKTLSDTTKNNKMDEIVSQFIQAGHRKIKDSASFIPSRFLAMDTTGYNYSWNKDKQVESGLFDQLVTNFGISTLRNLQKNRPNYKRPSGKLKADSIKAELMVDSGMNSIRTTFGDSTYMQLSNAYGMPTRFSVSTGAAGFMLTPLPTITNTSFMTFWMTLLNEGQNLEMLANKNSESFNFFPLQYHLKHEINLPNRNYPHIQLSNVSSIVNSTFAPFSSKRTFGKRELLIEARPGIMQLAAMLIGVSDLSPIYKELSDWKKLIIYLFIILIVVLIVLAFITSNDIASSISSLIQGMKEVRKQNFQHRLDSSRNDEIGALFSSYNNMIKGLAEKEIMSTMMSKDARDKILNHSNNLVSRSSKYVLLFIGIPGFEMYSFGAKPKELIGDLKQQVSSICEVIKQNGGDIDKIIGDKLLAIFPCNDNEKIAFKNCHNTTTDLLTLPLPFPIAIGVNYGTVISGFLGVGEKRDFTIIGDAVNVAARIEAIAEKMRFNRCLFSEFAINLVQDKSSFVKFDKVDLKGKATSITLYRNG